MNSELGGGPGRCHPSVGMEGLELADRGQQNRDAQVMAGTGGRKNSYTELGMAELNAGNEDAAIEALSASMEIYPCPVSTAGGLRRTLANRLAKEVPRASLVVEEYWRFCKYYRV